MGVCGCLLWLRCARVEWEKWCGGELGSPMDGVGGAGSGEGGLESMGCEVVYVFLDGEDG